MTTPTCFRISGLILDLTAAPPSSGAVQKLAGSVSSQTHTEILLPSGCQAADVGSMIRGELRQDLTEVVSTPAHHIEPACAGKLGRLKQNL